MPGQSSPFEGMTSDNPQIRHYAISFRHIVRSRAQGGALTGNDAHLARDPDLEREIVSALSSSRLPSNLLELEITETTVLGSDDALVRVLHRLRSNGVGIAFDDYGTGFASLSQLKRYPLTRLKIDRQFVRDLESDSDDTAIVQAVLALGRSMKMDVIAEGVETGDQHTILQRLGCEEGQGYFYGKPMSGAALRDLVTKSRSTCAA